MPEQPVDGRPPACAGMGAGSGGGVKAASRNIGPELQTGSRAKRAGSVFSATHADGIRRAVPPAEKGEVFRFVTLHTGEEH